MIKKIYNVFNLGLKVIKDPTHIKSKRLGLIERRKKYKRTDVINLLLSFTNCNNYLEIGIRNPEDNFDLIQCKNKYSVDPGFENDKNPAIYKYTSDIFFEKLTKNELDINSSIKFDVIFIDGLHLADQAYRDILNALHYISDNGFIVMHDCNPPDEYYAREDYSYSLGPSGSFWNGTTWKAFYKARHLQDVYSGCVDCDWGVGILSKNSLNGLLNRIDSVVNLFYEFKVFESNRSMHLNLITYEQLISTQNKVQ